jgi:hypothetical protein
VLTGTAFAGTANLTSIGVTGSNTSYSSGEGVLYDTAKGTLIKYPQGKTGASFPVPGTVTKIGASAFAASTVLRELVIEAGLLEVEAGALPAGCTALVLNGDLGDPGDASASPNPIPPTALTGTFPTITSLTVGADVEYIDTAPFETSSVSNITTLTLNTVAAEGIDAFDQITSLTLGPDLSSLGSFDISTTYTLLTGIGVDAANIAYSASDGILYNKAGTELVLYVPLHTGDSFIVPTDSTLNSIKTGAFKGSTITSLVLNKAVTIESEAFNACTDLATLVLGAVPTLSATLTVADSFSGCTSLDTLDLRVPLTTAIANFPSDITNLIIGATGVNLSVASIFSDVDTLVINYALGTIHSDAFGTPTSALENLEVNGINLAAAFPVVSVKNIKITGTCTIATGVFAGLTATELHVDIANTVTWADGSFKIDTDEISLKTAYTGNGPGDYEYTASTGWAVK